MPDLSTRINALIAYLFLGPIMLLARSGTPLADPYVRGHAKKASLIIILGALAFFIYRSLHGYLAFGIFGISLDLLVISTIVSITLLILMIGAYRAYHGNPASESSWGSLSLSQNTLVELSYSEEDKIRIVASFIPWIGIIVASQYPRPETIIGKKVGSLFAFAALTTLIFLSGTTTTLMLMLTTGYIALIVVTAVQLFASSRFLELSLYSKIPTYTELDAHIKASIITGYDYCRVAFGGAKSSTYREAYKSIISRTQSSQLPTSNYQLPLWIVGLPIVNLLMLPSLWQIKYREYTPLIIEGIALTGLTIVIIVIYGLSSQMGLYLLFPIISLIVGSKNNTNTRAPLVSIASDIYQLFTKGKEKMTEIQKNGEEKIGYSYKIDS